jgi:hypothetical protein
MHVVEKRASADRLSCSRLSPTCLRLMRCIIIIVKTVDLWKAAARRLLLEKKIQEDAYARENVTTKVHLDTEPGRVKLKQCLQEFSQI